MGMSENITSTRYLTVYGHLSPRNSYYCEVPKIRLCGKWLEENGFSIGGRIKVIIIPKGLVILRDE